MVPSEHVAADRCWQRYMTEVLAEVLGLQYTASAMHAVGKDYMCRKLVMCSSLSVDEISIHERVERIVVMRW